jgi:hypothetical protein
MAIYVSGIICREILEEAGNILSAIRITDVVSLDIPESVDISKVEILPAEFYILLVVRSDEPEEFDLEFTPIAPTGSKSRTQVLHSKVSSGVRGNTFRIATKVDARLPGLWWLEIKTQGRIALKMPLHIRHNRVPDLVLENPLQTQDVSPSE